MIAASVAAILATLNLAPLLAPPPKVEYAEGDLVEKDLLAPISFPLPKDSARLAAEQDSAAAMVLPVITLEREVENQWKQTLRNLRLSPDSLALEYSDAAMELLNARLFTAADSVLEAIRSQGYFREKEDVTTSRVIILVGDREIEESVENMLGFWDVDTLIENAAHRFFTLDRARESILKDILRRIVLPNPNLMLEEEETDARRIAARERVSPYEGFVERGELIIEANQNIDAVTIKKIQALNTELSKNWRVRLQEFLRQNLLFIFFIVIFGVSLYLAKRHFRIRDILFTTALIVVGVTLSFVLKRFSPWWLVPTGFVTLAVALFISPVEGTLAGVMLSLILYLPWQAEPVYLLYALLTATGAILALPFMRSRIGFVIALGFILAGGLFARGSFLITRSNLALQEVAELGMAIGINAVLNVGFFLVAFLAAERIFGYASNLTLRRLADLNRPLFKEFALKAAGSYHHSIVVGNLSERAAAELGGNPILALAGGYYHDIGKMAKPQYFIENQLEAANPHDALKPRMSAIILASHVKEGLVTAKRNRLPKPIKDIITQHHGTTCMEFFYLKHLEAKDEDQVPESDFRYPGPKPQAREAGIVMLADSVEAAVRAQSFADREDLEKLIKGVIAQKIADGQLDECAFTTRDISLVRKVFVETLLGIFHPRVSYEKKENNDRGPEKSPRKTRSAKSRKKSS